MKAGHLQKSWQTGLFAVFLVAGTLFYFLLFAQFGFLHRIALFPSANLQLRAIMGTMGAGGIIGSILAAFLYRTERARLLLSLGLLGSALVAGAAALIASVSGFLFAGFFIGLTLGVLTVSVVPTLRLLLPRKQIGIWTGAGVGFGYALSNLPPLFHGSATIQCGAVAVTTLFLGAFCLLLPLGKFDPDAEGDSPPQVSPRSPFLIAVVAFTVLIWLDSALFLILQETADLHERAWASDQQLWIYGALHFVFAVASGHAQDRGYGFLTLGAALCGLVGGSILLQFGTDLGAAAYVVGVSFYSAPLVAWCAREPSLSDPRQIARRAALLYGVAGWFGSALGIGMAQDLHHIPLVFLATATVLFGGILLWHWASVRPANPEIGVP